MTATITAAATWPARALWRLLLTAYLRRLIADAERDLFWMEQDLERLPKQIEIHRAHLSSLGVRLIDAEQS